MRIKLFRKNVRLDICLQCDQSKPLRINQGFLTSLTLILCIYCLFLITYGRAVRSHHHLLILKAPKAFLQSSNHHVSQKRQRRL